MDKPQTVLDVLNAMDDTLSDESKWTKGWYAKNINGLWRKSTDKDAVCWCLVGSAVKFEDDSGFQPNSLVNQTLGLLGSLIPVDKDGRTSLLSSWNDTPQTTFQDVKNLLKRAKKQVAGQ